MRRRLALGIWLRNSLPLEGAMQGYPRTGLEVGLERPVGFDAVDVDDRVTAEHRQIAGLADFVHHPAQDRAALGAHRVVGHHVDAEARQTVADAISLAGGFALNEASAFEHRQDAESRGARQAGLLDDLGQRHRTIRAGHEFHDREGTQCGGRGFCAVVHRGVDLGLSGAYTKRKRRDENHMFNGMNCSSFEEIR
jgi:hypothetical protein